MGSLCENCSVAIVRICLTAFIVIYLQKFRHGMFTKNELCIFFCIGIIFLGCNSEDKKNALKFELVSSSLYVPDSSYNKDLLGWKKYYEKCIKSDLFPDAYYLHLQDKIYIGSINNEHEIDVNKGINILDTSNGKSPFSLMSVVNS